ncbi:MAG: hypothetical protein ACTSPW_20135 [Promethearchaeota archaeon]
MNYKKEIVKINNMEIELILIDGIWFVNKGKDCRRTGTYIGCASKKRLIQAIKKKIK